METVRRCDWDDEFSVVTDEGDVGFLDFEDDKSLQEYDFDEGPVLISTPFSFSNKKPQSALVGETCADSITIRNTTDDPIELWNVKIFSCTPKDSYILSLMKPPSRDSDQAEIQNFVGLTSLEDRVLQPRETLKIWLSCKPKEIGLHTGVIHFDVGDERIERVAFLLADDNVSQALVSTNPYSRAPRRRGSVINQYVAGSRPPRTNTHQFKFRLPPFEIPTDTREIVESKQVPDVILEGLNRRTYGKYFSTLIVMEEIHLEEEMRGHDMECVAMKRRGNHFLSLVVPGLAEKRPSLVCGDHIFAKLTMDGSYNDDQIYQGYIHRVEADEIYLKFAKEFHQRHRDGDLYNVSFTYNRVNMRRLYMAIREAETLGSDFLFPSQQGKGRVIKNGSISPLNPNINKEQISAVQKILECRGYPPYVIHGPPGTGKTMTLVEAILQLYKTKKNARILVCASSNCAADHVLEKLVNADGAEIQESKIFRLNASSRSYEDVRPDFIGYCFFEDMVFTCPPLKALLRYRIIISTYTSASLLYSEGIRRGHFTHIILDEAGQASEPETMVPVANLCRKETVVVLAGDPMQLGPVVYSKNAEGYGLGKSYLERLFEYDFYRNGDENYVTKLVRNYRCHPAILDLPSKLFYKGELLPSKEDNDLSIYDLLDLPNKEFPVLFVGVQGCDEREGNNPSWFNRIEASKVVDFIRKLKRNTDLTESDIGVITPYRQQVLKLKKALEDMEMPDVKVGSVEQFQGQERRVIIISTVRSTIRHNEFDQIHHLGFLSNPRRFNVAITRAGSLLVIIGNPHIISKDPHWNKLLRHCADNGSYQGCPLPSPEAQEQVIYTTPVDNQGPYSNETEWDDYIPETHSSCNATPVDNQGPYSNETEWDDYIPETHSSCNATPVDNQGPYSNETEWDDYIPETHSSCNATGWGDEASTSTYTNEVDKARWGKEDQSKYHNDGGWREEGNRYSDEVEWGKDFHSQQLNGESGWGYEHDKSKSAGDEARSSHG